MLELIIFVYIIVRFFAAPVVKTLNGIQRLGVYLGSFISM
jgi:hypothetical protein